jgi:hypothetical protein
LALKTGASTETLSVLALVAHEAQVSTDDLSTSLKFLARSTSELQAGSVVVSAAFRAIGLSAKDLKGLSLDQVILKIADAQSHFGDGAGKTAALLKIFGRGGEEIIPVLHELANGGFDEAAKKAAALGAIVHDQDVAAAKEFTHATSDLTSALKGAVVQLSPLIKTFGEFIDKVAQFIGQHPDFAAFGIAAGTAALGVTALAVAFGAVAIAVGALEISLAPVLIGIGALVILAGGVGALAAAFHQASDAAKQFGITSEKSAGKGGGLPQVVLTDPAVEKALRDARIAAAQEQAKSELAITQAKIKNQEEQDAAAFAIGLSSLSTFFQQRRSIVQQGVAAELASLAVERSQLQRQITAPGITQADELKIATQIKAIDTQIATTKINGQTQLNALLEEERVKRLALQQQIAGFVAQTKTAQGDQIGAAQVQIAETVRQFGLALAATGALTKQQINEAQNAFSTLLTNRASFEEEQRQGERALAELELQRQQINDKANLGLISQHEAQLQIAAVERDRLPALQQLGQAMLFFAEQTKDLTLIQAAKQFAQQFASIGTVVEESTRQIAALGQSIRDAGRQSISALLTTGINSLFTQNDAGIGALRGQLQSAQKEMNALLSGPPSDEAGQRIDQLRQQISGLNGQIADAKATLPTLGNILVSAAAQFASSVQRILGDILSTKFVEAITHLFDAAPPVTAAGALSASAVELDASGGVLLTAAGALAAAAAALAAAGSVTAAAGFTELLGSNVFGLALAGGGFVSGPGTGTSDSILARLSAGEFVFPARIVQQLGVPFLESLSGMRSPTVRTFSSSVPAFASGGLVSSGGGDAGSSGSLEATIGLEDGLVVRHLATRGGVKGLLRVMSANPGAFKAALGLT